MNLSAEEKLMYAVMKAICDSGIPVSFKGSMVLKACLMEAGFTEDTRHTVDIDGNWNSETPPTAAQMVESLQNALMRSGIDLEVSITRMYSPRCSAGFDLQDRETGDLIFSIDMDVNKPVPPTRSYEVDGLRFYGSSPAQMLADKVASVSSKAVFWRVKDIVDLYYFSKVFRFNKNIVLQTLKNSGSSLGKFYEFLHQPDEIRHAYEKFRFKGGVYKPPFEEVYRTVKLYIKDVLPREKKRDMER